MEPSAADEVEPMDDTPPFCRLAFDELFAVLHQLADGRRLHECVRDVVNMLSVSHHFRAFGVARDDVWAHFISIARLDRHWIRGPSSISGFLSSKARLHLLLSQQADCNHMKGWFTDESAQDRVEKLNARFEFFIDALVFVKTRHRHRHAFDSVPLGRFEVGEKPGSLVEDQMYLHDDDLGPKDAWGEASLLATVNGVLLDPPWSSPLQDGALMHGAAGESRWTNLVVYARRKADGACARIFRVESPRTMCGEMNTDTATLVRPDYGPDAIHTELHLHAISKGGSLLANPGWIEPVKDTGVEIKPLHADVAIKLPNRARREDPVPSIRSLHLQFYTTVERPAGGGTQLYKDGLTLFDFCNALDSRALEWVV